MKRIRAKDISQITFSKCLNAAGYNRLDFYVVHFKPKMVFVHFGVNEVIKTEL